MAGRLTVAHGKKALSQEFPPSSSGRGALGPGGIQGWASGWEQRRRVWVRSRRTWSLGALPTSVCSTYLRYRPHVRTWPGRAGLPEQGWGAAWARGLPPTSQARASAPRGSPPVPKNGASFSSPAGSSPPALPPVGTPLLPRYKGGTSPLCPLGSVLSGPGPRAARGPAQGPAMSPPHRQEAANSFRGGSLVQLDSESLQERERPAGRQLCSVSAPSSSWGCLKESQGPGLHPGPLCGHGSHQTPSWFSSPHV